MRPPQRDIAIANLAALILPASSAVVAVRRLKPRSPGNQIQVQPVSLARLPVDPIEDARIVSAIMQRPELGRSPETGLTRRRSTQGSCPSVLSLRPA